MTDGTVEAIHLAPASGETVEAREAVEVVAGRGLRGDRHFVPDGGEARDPGAGEDLTLIEAEAVDAAAREFDIELGPGEHRRNLTTSGVALNHLVGEVVCRGVELCESCRHLEGLTEDGVIQALVHRGGLRADVLESGTVRVGDTLGPL